MGSTLPATPERDTAPQWRSTRGELLVEYCRRCAKAFYYPRGFCPFCLQAGVRWLACSGAGTLYSYSVVRRGDLYVIAYVTLEEGPTLLTHIVDSPLAQIAIGAPVTLVFKDIDGIATPMFRLASTGPSTQEPA